MSNEKLELLCLEVLKTIQEESNIITKQMDTFFEENKQDEDIKNIIENEFYQKIISFKKKYSNAHIAIINKDNRQDISLFLTCDEKRKEIVDNLLNYTKNLILNENMNST